MKAVIMAAGYGTRFLPASKTLPKEMFPLLDKPVIQFLIDELLGAGISDILIISHRKKKVLEDYFDRDPELEAFLAHNKKDYYSRCIAPPPLHVQFVRQHHMNGSGGALLLAKSFVRQEPFILAYPDDVVVGEKSLSLQLMEAYAKHPQSILASENLEGDVSRFGVIRKGKTLETDLSYVEGIVEKPPIGKQPSQTISIGRYLLTADIFPLLEEGYKTHSQGEFVLTKALETLAEQGKLLSLLYKGTRLDVGDPFSYVKSLLFLIRQNPDYASLLNYSPSV